MVNAVWGTENEAGRRIAVECLITDVLYRIRQHDSAEPSGSALPPPSPMPRLHLRGFAEASLSFRAVSPAGKPVVINGRCDVGFGYIEDEEEARRPLAKQHTFLAVLEAKRGGMFDSAFPQLLAYMATIHHARREAGKKNTTVYGIMSDGLHYAFVEVDNNSMV